MRVAFIHHSLQHLDRLVNQKFALSLLLVLQRGRPGQQPTKENVKLEILVCLVVIKFALDKPSIVFSPFCIFWLV